MAQVNAAEVVSTDEDLRSLERTRLRALVERDLELARTLHSPEFHLITPRGSTYSRESYLQAVEVGKIVYLKWEAAGILVRRLGAEAMGAGGAANLGLRAARSSSGLPGRALRRAVATEDAAVALLGSQERLAVRALVEPLAGVGRHRLGLRATARRAGDRRFERRTSRDLID